MARDSSLLERRNKQIRNYYDKLRSKREQGVRKYAQAYCVQLTSERFYLSPRTIEGIVFASD